MDTLLCTNRSYFYCTWHKGESTVSKRPHFSLNIQSWDYYLQRGPASLGRSGDPVWQQETEPVFWLEVLRSDIKVYHVSVMTAHHEGKLNCLIVTRGTSFENMVHDSSC